MPHLRGDPPVDAPVIFTATLPPRAAPYRVPVVVCTRGLMPSFSKRVSAAEVVLLFFPYVENEGLGRCLDSLVEVSIPVKDPIDFESWCEE